MRKNQLKTRRHKFTQDYPSERADYPASAPKAPARSVPPATPSAYHPVQGNPRDGGKISPAEAERISSEDFPANEEPSMPLLEDEKHKKAA